MFPETIFCSLSTSPQAWYRCGLPANALELDWIGITKAPGEGFVTGGNVAASVNPMDYDILIAQLAHGKEWEKFIKDFQNKGGKVIYEIDDFVHGVRRAKGHKNKSRFNKKKIKDYETCMSLADAMICSTDFLAEQYKKYNENVYVCKNSIDTWRYLVEKPQTDKTIVGWSGGTGHNNSVIEALKALLYVMRQDDSIEFWTFGYTYHQAIEQVLPGRTKFLPWVSLENYPYAISSFDISLAPGHESKYIKSKSDLRWLEASAVGIPVIGDKRIYHEIEDGVTGLYAETSEEYIDHLLYLTNPDKGQERRSVIASQAQDYVRQNRDIAVGSNQWREVLLNI